MTRKTIILFLHLTLTKFCVSQTVVSPDYISKTGYGKTIIGMTLMQDIINTKGSNYTLVTITYLAGLTNVGGGCLKIMQVKKFYRYKDLGVTYIVTSGDTISGIIFYPPFNGPTDRQEIIEKTKVSSLNISKIRYSHPDAIRGNRHVKRFSENAKHYVNIDSIYYGFKNKRKTITEIRIGY